MTFHDQVDDNLIVKPFLLSLSFAALRAAKLSAHAASLHFMRRIALSRNELVWCLTAPDSLFAFPNRLPLATYSGKLSKPAEVG